MTTNIARNIYIVYVTIWLLLAGQYLDRIYSQVMNHEGIYQIVNEAIVANFLLGIFGLVLTCFISGKKGIYVISTFAIGTIIASRIVYLDGLGPSGGAQSHMNSISNLFLWLVVAAIVITIGTIVKIFSWFK
jgi:hypothetical protein